MSMIPPTRRCWLLGAADPEMATIERLLHHAHETVAYACRQGIRVRPHEAYGPIDPLPDPACPLITVECAAPAGAQVVGLCDHHRPGDPGYGQPPARFLEASSLGQVLLWLGDTVPLPSWTPADQTTPGFHPIGSSHGLLQPSGRGFRVPRRLTLIAAADHCLEAAYRGRCPGISPRDLGLHRLALRARFQGRPCQQLAAELQRAQQLIAAAERITLGGERVADLRAAGFIPELKEAAVQRGIAVLSLAPGPGAARLSLMAAPPACVAAFLAGEGPADQTLPNRWGDPARGYAGGWLQTEG